MKNGDRYRRHRGQWLRSETNDTDDSGVTASAATQ